MPAVLQRLARHSSVQTTMTYYVDLDVDEMADDLWSKHGAETAVSGPSGNKSGNIGPVSDPALADNEAATYNRE
jgi:hypothetical protein